MQNRILSCALLLALVILATPRLHAVCFEPKIRVDDEFFVSDLVFIGTLVTDHKIGLTPEGYYDEDAFTWRVQRVFRGAIHSGDMLRTYSGNDSGRFIYDVKAGQHFLIFAISDPTHKGGFVADSCGNSLPLSQATRTISELSELPNRHGGLLYGKMIDGDVGVRITATGLGRKYSTVTGHNGKFSLPIPPGTYSVTATKTGHIYADFDLAYKHSNAVTVPDGGSAGLAFREKGK
jgi:hypothetical protein